jgi:CheY-like chemotaxis protein
MRILLVEDERRIAQSIKKGLEQERYAVDMVFDGIQGYDMASTEEYDCVVLDIMLPGMDGISLTARLRKDKIRAPILMLTAKSQISKKTAPTVPETSVAPAPPVSVATENVPAEPAVAIDDRSKEEIVKEQESPDDTLYSVKDFVV